MKCSLATIKNNFHFALNTTRHFLWQNKKAIIMGIAAAAISAAAGYYYGQQFGQNQVSMCLNREAQSHDEAILLTKNISMLEHQVANMKEGQKVCLREIDKLFAVVQKGQEICLGEIDRLSAVVQKGQEVWLQEIRNLTDIVQTCAKPAEAPVVAAAENNDLFTKIRIVFSMIVLGGGLAGWFG